MLIALEDETSDRRSSAWRLATSTDDERLATDDD